MTSTSSSIIEQTTFTPPLLCLDIGGRRIGVAVCGSLGRSAHGIARLNRKDQAWPIHAARLAREYACTGIIIGLPINMDGSQGAQAEDCRAAANQMREACSLPIQFWDERLSTWEAKQRLRELGLSEKKVAERVDQTAAAIILESFLAAQQEASRG
ncbi:MAG: Holliday junction resolvase RuvX [Mariprofundaceae bacterium]